MVHATPGGWSKQGTDKKGKPWSPRWVVGPRTVQVWRVVGKDASILQALDILVIPSSCDTYPFMLFPSSPRADQKCAIYCEPLSQDPGGQRDRGVNVKSHLTLRQAVGKEEGLGFNLTVYLATKESPLPVITMPRVPVLQYCTCSRN